VGGAELAALVPGDWVLAFTPRVSLLDLGDLVRMIAIHRRVSRMASFWRISRSDA
jgi:hypothetical protein